MIRNYFLVAWRNLLREKSFAFINLAGLSVGIASVLLIVLYLNHETSYDRFVNNGDRIFRVLRVSRDETGDKTIGVTSAPFAEAMKTDYPDDIEAVCRVMPNDGLFSVGDRNFVEKKLYITDANFFDFFSFELEEGNPATALEDPNGLVLTRSMARKYFGNQNPMGRTLRLEDRWDVKVTGVIRESTAPSHMDFDFLVSLKLLSNMSWFSRWWSNSLCTYVRMRDPGRKQELERLLSGFMDKHFGEDFKRTGRRTDLKLQPLHSIYLDNDTTFDMVQHGNRSTLYVFLFISLSILVIAGLNFMNLSTARSAGRSREVGVRKVMGARRFDLIVQFIGESFIMVVLATIVGILLVELAMPWVNRFTGRAIDWPSDTMVFTAGLATFILMISLGAGLYPAFVLSSFQPTSIIKGSGARRNSAFWKSLIILQFSISVILIVATLTIRRQMDFMTAKKLGFESAQTLTIPLNNRAIREDRYTFRERLETVPGVASVALASGEPGGFHDRMAFEIRERAGDFTRMRSVFTDFGYVTTLGLDVLAGRNFSRSLASDSTGMVINHTAAATLGWSDEEALGQEVRIDHTDDQFRHVIGVVADYHFSSLKEDIEPLAISVYPDHRQAIVRIATADIRATLAGIEKTWSEITPKYPFEYSFLDDRFARLYAKETKEQTVISIFALLAVAIACLGLFGLASYAAERRTKEIGIRKVLGATVPGLVSLFVKEFLVLVVSSFLIAIPAAYYLMNRWLEDFAYRTTVGPFVLIGAALMAVAVAMITVGYQAIRTANANPVESLRCE